MKMELSGKDQKRGRGDIQVMDFMTYLTELIQSNILLYL